MVHSLLNINNHPMYPKLKELLAVFVLSVAMAFLAPSMPIHAADRGSGKDKSGDSGNGGAADNNSGGNSDQNAGRGATLHIGFGAGTPCAVGCGGDPNLSGTSNPSAFFDIYQTSNGANPVNPVLLIIGVPNQTSPTLFNLNSIIGLTSINSYPGGPEVGSSLNSWTYGTTAFGLGSDVGFGLASGYRGEFTALTGGDVYSFLGLPGGNNSNNWPNWRDSDLALAGIDATGFGIYVFALNGDLGPNGLMNINFLNSSTVPAGSYLIGYSPSTTPFTEAGLYSGGPPLYGEGPSCSGDCTRVPEPEIMLLLGAALLGLAVWRKKN